MNRRLNILCAWLLLAAAQFGLMAHAVEFGAEAHEHAGAPCHLLLNEDADDVLASPPASLVVAGPVLADPCVAPATVDVVADLRTSLPPPTGPPSLIL